MIKRRIRGKFLPAACSAPKAWLGRCRACGATGPTGGGCGEEKGSFGKRNRRSRRRAGKIYEFLIK